MHRQGEPLDVEKGLSRQGLPNVKRAFGQTTDCGMLVARGGPRRPIGVIGPAVLFLAPAVRGGSSARQTRFDLTRRG